VRQTSQENKKHPHMHLPRLLSTSRPPASYPLAQADACAHIPGTAAETLPASTLMPPTPFAAPAPTPGAAGGASAAPGGRAGPGAAARAAPRSAGCEAGAPGSRSASSSSARSCAMATRRPRLRRRRKSMMRRCRAASGLPAVLRVGLGPACDWHAFGARPCGPPEPVGKRSAERAGAQVHGRAGARPPRAPQHVPFPS